VGHEYVGVVEEVGADVSPAKPGQFVIGSFKRIT
jgi:Zn-dependent alcohol dehydrogenase